VLRAVRRYRTCRELKALGGERIKGEQDRSSDGSRVKGDG
jgi:hypothetical protein